MFQQFLMIMCSVISLFLLAACDGGGSNSSKQEAPVSQTGYLVDSAVSGVAYSTPTLEGVTGSDGSFQYREDEIVRFMLGGTLLGEVPGAAQISPFELAGSEVIAGMRGINEALRSKGNAVPDTGITESIRSKLEIEEQEYIDPFHTVINIAILLQSMDSDANPENGIEITTEVAALFEGVALDLEQRWEIFREEFELRHVLGQANSMGLFSRDHGIARPAPALQHLYTTLGVDAEIFGLAMRQPDADGDGSPDATATWMYDDAGNMTQQGLDAIGDNRPDLLTRWQYDASGNVTRYEKGGRNDFTEIETWQYDPYGYLLRFESDWDADGMPDRWVDHAYDADNNVILEAYEVRDSIVTTETWRYHENGELREYRRESDSEPDGALDGSPELIFSEEYDENGNIMRDEIHHVGGLHQISSWQYDAGGNVTWQEHRDVRADPPELYEGWRHHYDTAGNLARREHIEVNEPVERVAAVETWQYDADNLVTRYENDHNADGTPDDLVTWQYDAGGRVIRSERDYGVDGAPERVESRTYNSDGKLTREENETFYNPDLTDEYTPVYTSALELWEFEYRANGHLAAGSRSARVDEAPLLVEESWQYDADGKLTRYTNLQDSELHLYLLAAWQYDSAGKVTLYELDENGDGTADSIERWQYDARGNATRIERIDDVEGIRSEVKTNQFDDHDNLIHAQWVTDEDGGLTRLINYQWQATGWGHLFALSERAPPNVIEEYEWPE